MSRYVDIENVKLKGISVFEQNLEVLIPLSDVRKSLQMTPTADVEEVRHAKWAHYEKAIRCSNCGQITDDYCIEGDIDSGYYTVLPHYCSNCGAKMDLEEKENG